MKNLRENAVKQIDFKGKAYRYYDINTLDQEGYNVRNMPYSIKVMLEQVLRQCDGLAITEEHIKNIADGPMELMMVKYHLNQQESFFKTLQEFHLLLI